MNYNTAQVADLLNVSLATVTTYCKNGKIKAIKVPSVGARRFKYVIEGDSFLDLIKEGPITRGPQEKGERLGPFRIKRLANGDLLTERM